MTVVGRPWFAFYPRSNDSRGIATRTGRPSRPPRQFRGGHTLVPSLRRDRSGPQYPFFKLYDEPAFALLSHPCVAF